jgi:hypothetical protein
LYPDGDPLTDSTYFVHQQTLYRLNRRMCASQQKSTGDTDPDKSLTDDSRLQGFDIGQDIREFRHSE